MTEGHKHRVVTVKSFDVWWVRALRRPVLVLSDKHEAYVERSRLVFGVRVSKADHHDEFFLTPLGILHALFGIVLYTEDDGDD